VGIDEGRTIMTGVVFKKQINIEKILISPIGEVLETITYWTVHSQDAQPGLESSWSLISSCHKYFLRDEVQLKGTHPINMSQLA
jgi:hypothetical protein